MSAARIPVLVVGAGFSGAVVANTLAVSGRFHVTVSDRRPHIGGNAWDCICPHSGVRFHPHGPHIFHTNDERVVRSMSTTTTATGSFPTVRLSSSTAMHPCPEMRHLHA